MGTIPFDPLHPLTAKQMRKRMEDKATIANPGSMYTWGSAGVTKELPLGLAGLPLVSNGDDHDLSYSPLTNVAFADGAVTKEKLGVGTIVQKNGNNKKSFDVSAIAGQTSGTPDKIKIVFSNVTYSLGNGYNTMKFMDETNTYVEYPVVKFIDGNNNESVWCKQFTLTEQKPSYGVDSITYNRTSNNYCPLMGQAAILPDGSVYYGDNITVSYTAAPYYTMEGSCNGSPIASGGSVTVASNVNVQFNAVPDRYTLQLSTESNSGLTSDTIIVTRISSNKQGAPLGVLTPTSSETRHAQYEVYEDDVIQLSTTAPIDTRDKYLKCTNDSSTQGGGQANVNIPVNTPITVNHSTFVFNWIYHTTFHLTFNVLYIQRKLTLTLNTGVKNIMYRQSTRSGWTTVTSSTIVDIDSGADVDLCFTPDTGYIGNETYYVYQTGNSATWATKYYTIYRMRTNQSWTPIVIHTTSQVYVHATYTGSGTNHPTCSLVVTNNMSERIYLYSTDAPLISDSTIRGTSLIGGASRTFTATGTGQSTTGPSDGDPVFLHCWTGGSSPLAPGTVHYGVVGTITVS